MRKLKLFFACLLMAVLSIGQVWAETYTLGWGTASGTAGTYTNFTAKNGSVSNIVSFDCAQNQGTTAPTYNSNNNDLRLYYHSGGNGGSITLTPAANVTITGAVLTSSTSPSVKYSVNGGTATSVTASNNTYTVSGISATSSLTFQNVNTSNTQLRIKTIQITYSISGSTKPTVSLDPDGGNFTGSVEVTIIPSTGATAYYTTDATKKTSPSTTTWTPYNGSAKPTFTSTTTIWAAAVKDDTWSDVVEKTFNKITPVTSYDIDFETNDLDLYVNWTFANIKAVSTAITAHGGTYYGNTDGKASASITTSAKYAKPGILTFYTSKESGNTTTSSWKAQVSENGTSWTDVETFDATTGGKGDWTKREADLSAHTDVYVRIAYSGSTAIRAIDDISLVEAASVAKPTISGETLFLTSTMVTLTQTEADHIYYTTNGSTPTTSSTEYTVPFELNATATVKTIAVKGGASSAVAEETFTKATIMTVAQALAASAGANQYVKGIISSIEEVSTEHGNATYNLKDESQENSIKIYRGKYLNDAAFTAVDQIYEGDEVTVFGAISQYKGVNQFAQGNYIVALKPVAKLAWSESSFEAELEGENTFPTLTNTNSVAVTYSSSNTNVATINANTGAIELKAIGTTTITAAFAGNQDYKANSVSYALEVKNSVIRADISFECYEATSCPDGIAAASNLPNPLPIVAKAGKNFGGWFMDSEFNTPAVAGDAVASTDPITLYAKWLDPYTVAEALAIIDELEDDGQTENSVYVAGIVCTAPTSNPSSGKLTFYISANGVESDRLQAYNCKGLNNANFEAKTDIQVMDELVIYGPLKKYIKNNQPVPEFNTGYLYSFNRPAVPTYSITYVENGANEDIEDVAEATNLPDPLPTVTKNEKIFGGWFTTATFEAGSEAVAGAPLSKDETLYAKWNDISPWAFVYTSNVEIASNTAAHVTINEANYDAAKTSKGASATITLPQGVTAIHLHLVAWNGEAQTVSVTGDCFNEAKELAIEANAGVSGQGTTYNLGASGTDYYFSLTPDNAVAADEVITITAASNKRFVLFGVNQEGGVLPVLDHIAITGTMTNTTGWKTGDNITPAGLTVNAYYTLNEVMQDPVDVTTSVVWSHDALIEDQTEVTLTATYTENTIVKSANVNVTIEAVETGDPTITTDVNSRSWTVDKDADIPATKTFAVTLKNITSATITKGGDDPDAFSVTPATLTASGNITVSVVSTATVGTYSASITIKDDASETSKIVNVNLTVNAPVVEETAVSTTSEWVAAEDADLVDGAEVLITGATGGVTYAIGVQNDNNRAAVAGTLSEGVFTPGENTMSFTLVAQEEEGVFALQASNGEYLYAASSTKNYLKRQATLDDNAKWTLTATSAVANGTNTHNDLKFNATNSPKIFSCYTGGQTAIQFYVPKPATPEPPTPSYTEVRNGLTEGWYYTMCLDKAVTAVQGATIWRVLSKAANDKDIILEEVLGTLDAGRPYIFRASASTLQVAYTGDAVLAPVTEGNNGLVGSFSQVIIANVNTNYIIYNNELYYVNTDNVYVGAHRAYLNMLAVPDYSNANLAPGRRRVTMAVHGEQVATGMDALDASEKPVKMVINGQLFILRGEKMYNVNGQLVK